MNNVINVACPDVEDSMLTNLVYLQNNHTVRIRIVQLKKQLIG